MFDSAVQLTFPYPACGGVLDVNLNVQPSATIDQRLANIGKLTEKKIDERRFRPVHQPPVR